MLFIKALNPAEGQPVCYCCGTLSARIEIPAERAESAEGAEVSEGGNIRLLI
jgi:hypothetical protein